MYFIIKKLVNIHKHICTILFFILYSTISTAQENKSFATLQQVLEFAKSKNIAFKNATLQVKIADLAKKTALGNAINPKISTSIQAIDNFKQQVSFLPGQVFGLPQGSFKEVTIGQQFVSTFSIQPQFDIFNMSNISQIKTAKINELLVENQNKLNEQNLYEKIDAVYFNILSFNAQQELLNEQIKLAEKIKTIVDNKFKEGIARKQDANEAEVNLITLQDKLEQVIANTKIQYQNLNLFFENEANVTLTQNIWAYEKADTILQLQNNLLSKNAKLQTQLAQQEYKSLQYQNLPVVSLISSFNWQNLSNDNFFAKNSSWINYNYVGLKLSYDLPTTVQKLVNTKNKQIQLHILKNNEDQAEKENEIRNLQMIEEYEKSIKQTANYKKIYLLKKDTYEKNYNQFLENILPLSQLLISQNDVIVSRLNMIAAIANAGFNKNKIEINNGL